jgi:flavin-dependent dehydrogenase
MKDIIIIGGGLAGLVNAIRLADAGFEVLVIEKKEYPFHRVCGEYISNEAIPYLKSIGADPMLLGPAEINHLIVSSPSGRTMTLPLELGGIGISRFSLDNFLYTVALSKGVKFNLNTAVTDVKFVNEHHWVMTSEGKVEVANIVIGGFGKRSNLDRQLERKFFKRKSPYIAVKYHILTDFPSNYIALHNFKDGYCGMSKIEGQSYCLCYLTSRNNIKTTGSINGMEEEVLYKNPFLKNIFINSDFLYDQPEVINEISFEPKSIVDQHILMAGDAAGMITPLCGNGMAMAIHSAKILSELIIRNYSRVGFDRPRLEKMYEYEWRKNFEKRLRVGRKIQQLFGKEFLTDFTVRMLNSSKPLGKWIVRQTHGEGF